MLNSSIRKQFNPTRIDGSNVDTYLIRKNILAALAKSTYLLQGNLVDIGCGSMPYKEFIIEKAKLSNYIGLDLYNTIDYNGQKPDVYWDGKSAPFPDNKFQCAIATEVLEHCFSVNETLLEINRILEKNGVFFFTVPFLWSLHESPNDHYRFTPYALEKLLKNNGFYDINIKVMGGWHASMAQFLGLWIKRSPMRNWKRKLLMPFIILIVRFLVLFDKGDTTVIEDGLMIPSIYGWALKK